MKRFAFTMLELLFVIVVIGILAILSIPKFSTSPLHQAAEQIANHIRYTQHIAMISDEFSENDGAWYKKRWQIRFYEKGTPDNYYYTIFSDEDKNKNVDYGAGKTEVVIDPLTNKKFHVSENSLMDLTGTYGIINVISSCMISDGSLVTSNKGVFAFDELGRPYNGVSNATSEFQYLLIQSCSITIQHKSDGNATIKVEPETGYVCILDNTTGKCEGVE